MGGRGFGPSPFSTESGSTLGLGDFLRRRDDDENPSWDGEGEELDPEEYYVLSKEGTKKILGWARFHAQLCDMMHEGDSEVCEDEEHKIAMLVVFALHPWLLYYDLIDRDEGGIKE